MKSDTRLTLRNCGRRKLSTAAILAITLGLSLAFICGAPLLRAQAAPASDSSQAAGAKIAFDVASVKENRSGEPAYRASSNFPLGLGDSYPPNGGLFTATNYPVSAYIGFAYKLTPYQTHALDAQLPKWARDERFDIQAKAGGAATKDQMRLMMRTLLADRFKLAVHTETRQGPIFALVLAKPGQPGPNLHARSPDSRPCGDYTTAASARLADGTPTSCDVFLTLVDGGHAQMSARDVSIEMIAGGLPFDRPVVDRTGLTGLFDFTMQWTPETTAAPNPQADETGTTYLEALKDQLGLKLEAATGTIDTLMIDHIEQPTAN